MNTEKTFEVIMAEEISRILVLPEIQYAFLS